jgi:hypothetical protein
MDVRATPLIHHTHLARREDVLANSQDLFDVVASGAVVIQVPLRMPLAEAAQAHLRGTRRELGGK